MVTVVNGITRFRCEFEVDSTLCWTDVYEDEAELVDFAYNHLNDLVWSDIVIYSYNFEVGQWVSEYSLDEVIEGIVPDPRVAVDPEAC